MPSSLAAPVRSRTREESMIAEAFRIRKRGSHRYCWWELVSAAIGAIVSRQVQPFNASRAFDATAPGGIEPDRVARRLIHDR